MGKGGNGALVTSSSIAVSAGTNYTIVVGAGGGYTSYQYGDYGRGSAGGSSSAFGLTAGGGAGASASNGANAGNGQGGAGSSSGNGNPGWVSFDYSITTPQYTKITLGTT